MANVEKQPTISLSKEDIELLREFPRESVDYIAENLDKASTSLGRLIQNVIDHVLPVKGQQVLEDGLV